MVLQRGLLQNQKCQTGDSKSFREKNNKTFSSSKSYQALTYETKSFHVKSTRPSREDFSKNQSSQNGNKFFIPHDQKRLSEQNKCNKIFFFVEKSPRRQRATPKVCTWAREEVFKTNFCWNVPKKLWTFFEIKTGVKRVQNLSSQRK